MDRCTTLRSVTSRRTLSYTRKTKQQLQCIRMDYNIKVLRASYNNIPCTMMNKAKLCKVSSSYSSKLTSRLIKMRWATFL